MPERIITKVAAPFKYPAGKPIMKALKHGDSLILEREPTNAYDPHAIKILAAPKAEQFINNTGNPDEHPRPLQLGYVPAPIAAKIHNRKIVGCTKDGGSWDAIAIEVE